MSQTTTAAASALKNTPLSFDGPRLLIEPSGSSTSPRFDIDALCRRTFVHLDSASPLVRLSQQPDLLKSFREFSSKLENIGIGDRHSKRRHTLTQVVIDDLTTVKGPEEPQEGDPILACQSPLARVTTRQKASLASFCKDDSFTPNYRQIPDDEDRFQPEFIKNDNIQLSGNNNYSATTQLRLPPTLPPQFRDSWQPKMPTYIEGLLFSKDDDIVHEDSGQSEIQMFNKNPVENRQSDQHSPSHSAYGGADSTNRSAGRLRPLADLLTEPWGNALAKENTDDDDGNHCESSTLSVEFTPKDNRSERSSWPANSLIPVDFSLSEWIGSLREVYCTESDFQKYEEVHDANTAIMRGSLSDWIKKSGTAKRVNIFASPAAQSLLAPPAPAESEKSLATQEDTQKPLEDSQSQNGGSGHPTACKPCAFFWSKGCMNGDKCRFCHEWHAPKKKKPMKDQKNLMIIAREDGRIAFLRCAIEDALKHQ